MQTVEILETSQRDVVLRVRSDNEEGPSRNEIVLDFLESFDARGLAGEALQVNPNNAVAGVLEVLKRAAAMDDSP